MMRVVALLGLVAAPCLAGPTTGDFTADVLDGLWSQSHLGPGGSPGNTLAGWSWDGATPAGQWTLGGAVTGSVTVIPGGWHTVYDVAGATLQLAPGPWNLSGPMTLQLSSLATDAWSDGAGGLTHSDLYLTGYLPSDPTYQFTIQGTSYFDGTGLHPGPPYPPFLPPGFTGDGAWGDIEIVSAQAIPEPGTWALLSVGLVGIIRRRRR